MKRQVLFTGKNKTNIINLLSAESAKSLKLKAYFALVLANFPLNKLWYLSRCLL